jgi:HAMP domain-containing protein
MTQQLRLTLDAWRRLARKIDPQRSALSARTHWLYSFNGATHSLLRGIQDASHAEVLKKTVPSPPIFLLGFWRSGTTFLHELFCCDPRFGFPSTLACLSPTNFLLTEKWVRQQGLKQSRRPMDDMKYSWASPQEDEFALLCLGAPSAYEALIAPSLLRDARKLVDLRQRPADEQERWKSALLHFVKLLTVQQAKTMVLKSPPHGFRLPALAALFPEGRYVVIERNPYEVFASNLKLWKTLLELYSLEKIFLDEIEEFVIESYVLHEQVIDEGARLLRANSFARVRYEDLLVNPLREIERLYQELALGEFTAVRPQIEKYVEGVAGHKRNRFRLSAAQKARVDQAWGNLIQQKGYSWPEEYVAIG